MDNVNVLSDLTRGCNGHGLGSSAMMDVSFTARLSNIMTLLVLLFTFSSQGAQSMFIADMHLFLLRSSAILEADTGLDRVAIQARAKVLEEKIHTQATSKVLCSALSSLSASSPKTSRKTMRSHA
jgi:hypothetical protein